MKLYILFVMILFQLFLIAEDNPFPIKEEFNAIDKADNTLFSTMKEELEKDNVIPIVVNIDFKNTDSSSASGNPSITKQKATINDMSTKNKMPVKIMNKEGLLLLKKFEREANATQEIVIKKAMNAQKNRIKQRVINEQERVKLWIKKNTVDIDLHEERRIKIKYLQDTYKRAVKEVDIAK